SGFQILYDTPRFHLDAWINWQSFIFESDTHQEAFIAGVTSEIFFHNRFPLFWFLYIFYLVNFFTREVCLFFLSRCYVLYIPLLFSP
ncbi:MAG: hypothetical protein II211_06030, partial [Peptococcaceae bacterium]|nr:hypothetical protein [Peptococcaceae bacterium]